MDKAKKFDCVRMKDEIQARLLREWRGLTDEEIQRRSARKLATSRSPFAKLWRELTAREKKQAKAGVKRGPGRRGRRTQSPA
jgi:hypothetical protein